MPTRSRLRCNVCSRLYITRSTEIKDDQPYCLCGSRVWYVSKQTLLEKVLFAVGFNKDADISLLRHDTLPLGGSPEAVQAAMEKQNNEQSSSS